MFALRGLNQARAVARVPRQAAVFQQKRGMAGGGGFSGCGPANERLTGAGAAQCSGRGAVRGLCCAALGAARRRSAVAKPRRPGPRSPAHRGRGRLHVCQLVGQPPQAGHLAQAPGALGTRPTAAPARQRLAVLWGGWGAGADAARTLSSGGPRGARAGRRRAGSGNGTGLGRQHRPRRPPPLPPPPSQLAWWGVAFWATVFYTAFGGKKKEAPAPAAPAQA